jgi:hypothetical protein
MHPSIQARIHDLDKKRTDGNHVLHQVIEQAVNAVKFVISYLYKVETERTMWFSIKGGLMLVNVHALIQGYTCRLTKLANAKIMQRYL